MKLLVLYGYAQKWCDIVNVEASQLPLDICPSMSCDLLEKLPEEGEVIYLGKSLPHQYSSDVMVKIATLEAEEFLSSCEDEDSLDAWEV